MRIAVVIPVFNGASVVGRAIESVLSQDFVQNYEVVAVNDGSTDSTAAVLAAFGTQVRIVNQPNRGLAAARNAGIAEAGECEYVAFLDADDLWMPDKLAITVGALGQRPESVLAYSDVIAVDDRGMPSTRSIIDARRAHPPSMAEMLRQWWPILPSTVVMRSDAFERCGRFCEAYRGAAGHEDVDLWLRARELGEFIYIDRPLVRYRVSSADPLLRYQDNFGLFALRTRARYGARSRRLLLEMRRGYANAFAARGLSAIGGGDLAGARRAFVKALGHRPLSFKNAMRLARTFLPLPIARALSGRAVRSDNPIAPGVADN